MKSYTKCKDGTWDGPEEGVKEEKLSECMAELPTAEEKENSLDLGVEQFWICHDQIQSALPWGGIEGRGN